MADQPAPAGSTAPVWSTASLASAPPAAGQPPRRAAVLGSPVAHSLSPVLHKAAYAELGLDWKYGRYDVDETSLPGFIAGLGEDWVGLSLTMPLKHAIIPLCDQMSPLASTVGAVNTVLFRPDRSVFGANTDVPGLVAALAAAGIEARPARTAVLGGGATATSALAAIAGLANAGLANAGLAGTGPPGVGLPADTGPVEVYVRSSTRVTELTAAADRLETAVAVRPWAELADAWQADLVISTVPSAGSTELAGTLPDRVAGLLFDVIYDPWPTPLAAAWQVAGARAVDGMSLLVQQAALQVELMTGRPGVAGQVIPAMERAAARARAH